jgi:hypothetical protein
MGFALVICIAFGIGFVILTTVFYLSCWLKRRYNSVENKADLLWITNVAYHFFTMFMCKSCKEACESHYKLIARAAFFAFLIALIIAFTKFYL